MKEEVNMTIVPIVTDRQENITRQLDIFSRLLKDRIIMLVGEIEYNLSNLIIAQLLHLEAENDEADIYMYINSPGGSVTAALAIYDIMKYISPKVVTVCMGEACSAASLLFCAGERRLLTQNARILLHQAMGGRQGQATDLDIYVKEILSIQKIIIDIYHNNTGISKDKLASILDRDTIFRGQEAIDLGLADELVTNKVPKRGVQFEQSKNEMPDNLINTQKVEKKSNKKSKEAKE